MEVGIPVPLFLVFLTVLVAEFKANTCSRRQAWENLLVDKVERDF